MCCLINKGNGKHSLVFSAHGGEPYADDTLLSDKKKNPPSEDPPFEPYHKNKTFYQVTF